VFADSAHQQLGNDLIEEALEVEIQNPRITPASLCATPTASSADLPGRYP
jgi:hypothetical protein